MKPEPKTRVSTRLLVLLLSLAQALPLSAFGAAVELATSPMATSTTTTVKPNLMFVLDDSGSMAWDYLPDTAKNFASKYGFQSANCNGNYYNENITYNPPVDSTGAALNATATTFSAAYKDGFNTGSGTTNLNTGFKGGSGSGSSGNILTSGPAIYYRYSGTQNTTALQNYFNTSSTFYQECNSNVGSTPGSSVFTLVRLAAIPTTTLTITGAAAAASASITITNAGTKSNPASVSQVKVTYGGNTYNILKATTGTTRSTSTLAGYIQAGINNCTGGNSGNCNTPNIPPTGGYSATLSGSKVTITGPAAAAGATLAITFATGSSPSATLVNFPAALSNSSVTSLTVASTQLLNATATANTPIGLASAIDTQINALTGTSGYSSTVSSNVVTITGPSAAANLTPAFSISAVVPADVLAISTFAFPESTPAKLQNFANWYSYYSNRMLMMKTGAGLAFNNVTDKYRVGFITMNNNVSPGIVEVNTFDATQRAAWFTKLYASVANNSTPLREILSRVGQYYAHKFGAVTTYTSTITVGGSGDTSVNSALAGSAEMMDDATDIVSTTSALAQQIANQINAPQVTDFGASASGNVVTILGPATASGVTPVVTDDGGGMTFTRTAFVATTNTTTLNGISPADPIQYSCQQNFTILSTDGYWNGATTYNLTGGTVGQVDGAAARPYNDGAQAGDTVTISYTNNLYSSTSSGCSSGKKQLKTQPQKGSCNVNVVGTPTGTESCTPSNWTNNGSSSTSGSCVSSVTLPSPNPSVSVDTGRVLTAGFIGGISDTLSDVALFYYQTDLRDNNLGNCTGALGTSVCENNVFQTGSDNQTQQHMTTFTLGLGVRGRMIYSSSYLTDTTGDFVSVKLGSTASASACTWQTSGTVCNWPLPSSGAIENVDDLWHAAVNGRGAYFSATDPVSLSNGMSNALTSISSKVGAAAAAATSTLNPVAGNNQAFVASYTTLSWTGNLEARGINTDTGVVNENANWCVENVAAGTCVSPGVVTPDASGDTTAYFCVTPNQVTCPGGTLTGTDCAIPISTACTGTMNSKVTDTTDTRTIKTADGAGAALIDFDTAYQAANSSYFNAALLAGLSQWPPASDVSAAADYFRTNAPGANLLKFLRGQHGHEFSRSSVAAIDQFFRQRNNVLGDALESQPAFIGAPIFSYPYPGYAQYLLPFDAIANPTGQGSRVGSVYMGTNDGMIHSFAADTGVERWAYVPSMVIPNMWKLADKLYSDKHTNYVNGSPVTTDICTANCNTIYNALTPGTNPVWKTILVSGLNGGGRGYFALDITDPLTPALLWEFTTTAGIGTVQDNDLGYSFGQPVVTRNAAGDWVVLVTSGYDNGTDSATKVSGSFVANSPAGSGVGYLYVLNAATGAIISKISTGVGTAANPSGLAKIAGFNTESTGNKVSYVYGGDLLGNLWRFDINSGAATTIGTGTALKFATLFSDSGGTLPQPIMTTPILGVILGKRVVFIGTGKYLEVSDLTNTQKQTQYAIKDDDASTTFVNPRTSLVQQFLINNPDGTGTRLAAASSGATTTGTNTVDFGSGRGWFVDLPDNRERVNIDAKLVLGTLLVPSIVPSATECSPGGTGWLNFLDYKTGGAVNLTPGIAGVRYDSTIVGTNVLFIDGSPVVEVVTSSKPTPEKDPNVQFKATAAAYAGKRVLWRELVPTD